MLTPSEPYTIISCKYVLLQKQHMLNEKNKQKVNQNTHLFRNNH